MKQRGKLRSKAIREIIRSLYEDSSEENMRKLAAHHGCAVSFIRGIARGSYPTIHRGHIPKKQ